MRSNKLSILALAALLLGAAPAWSATIVVDSLSDTSVASDGQCSCREAIANANADDNVASGTDCVAGSGDDIITLPSGTIILGSPLTLSSNLTLSGAGTGATVLDGATVGNLTVSAAVNVTVSYLSISQAAGQAAIDNWAGNLTVTAVRITDPVSRGIFSRAGSTLTVLDSEVEGAGNTGIQVAGNAWVKRSSVHNGAAFGLVHNTAGDVVIENSTFYTNLNVNIAQNVGAMTLDYVTSTDALAANGFGVNAIGGTVVATNSIIYGNIRDVNVAVGGSFVSGGYNTLSTTATAGGTLTLGATGENSNDPLLQAGANNGGVGNTLALGALSPARNSADPASTVALDQRGVARPQGAGRDRGAYEAVAASVPAVSALSFASAPISGTTGLVITGTDFTAPLTVTVKGISTTFAIDSATQITAAVPANTAGSGRVVVTAGSGSSADVAADDFSYNAGPIVVNTSSDTVANDGACSCREAVQNANSDSINARSLPGECGGGTGADTITLPAGTFDISSADLVVTSDVTISGAGKASTTIDGANSRGVVFSDDAGAITATLQDLTVFRGYYSAGNAAVFSGNNDTFTLRRVIIQSATIRGLTGANLTVEDSLVHTVPGFGILVDGPGASVIRRSAVINAVTGIWIGGSGSVALRNSTLYGNSTRGLFRSTNIPVTVNNSTITGNGVGIENSALGTINVSNSIIVNNSTVDFNSLAGTITSLGYNFYWFGAITPDATDSASIDPLLVAGAPVDNGGETPSIAIPLNSPARDRVGALGPKQAAESNDQRGVSRPQILRADVGAYEAVDAIAPVPVFQAPANGAHVASGSSPLWALMTDNLAVQAGTVTMTVNTIAQSYDFDGVSLTRTGAALADGFYEVTLTASDASANTGTAYLSFTVDTLTPTAAAFPADGGISSVSATAWAHISDLNLNPNALTLTVNGVDGHIYSAGSITSTVAPIEGLNAVTLTASDLAGNTLSLSWVFTLDTLSPTAAAYPADGAFSNVSAAAWAQLTEMNVDPNSLTLTVNGVDGHIYSNGSITSTAAPIEGLNAVTLTATDLAGNSLVLSWVYTLDTVNPAITAFPTNGAFTNVSGAAWAQIVDANTNAGALTITVNGASFHTFNAGSLSSTVAAIEGLNAITVTASDLAGNSSTLSWVYTLDTIVPTANIQAPLDLTWTANSSPAIWATVADANLNAPALTLEVNGFFGYIYSNGSITSTASGLSDGPQAVTLTVSDLAGNTLTLPWLFHVDTTAPSAANGAPTGLTNVAAQTVTASIDDFGGIGVLSSGLQVNLDGAPAAFSFDGVTLTLTASTFTDGIHYVQVVPTDQLGNVGSNYDFQFTVITDPNPPLAYAPSPVGVTSNASPLIYASLTDTASGVAPASVSMTVDGAPVAYLASASEVSFAASALLPGVHVVTVDLKDVAGNQATQLVWQFTITSDTIAPTVGNPSPLGVTNTGTPFIYASLSDLGGSGVDPLSVSMTVDGAWVSASADATEVSFTPLSVLADGTHTVTVDVADLAGNQATQFFWTFEVASDTEAPVISDGTPSGLTTNVNVLITAALSDTGNGIDPSSVRLSLDGLTQTAVTDGVTVSFTASALSLGVHTVNVDAKDQAGNAAAQLSWSFTVANIDTTAPTISAGAPTGLTTNVDTFITAALVDGESGIDSSSVAMSLDGQPVAFSTDGVTVSYTATALADGVHTVNVDVKDMAGNQANQLSWSFFVGSDPFAPVVSGASPTGIISDPNPLITAALSDQGSGIDTATVVMTLNGATVTAVTDGVTVSYTASALPDGVHTVEVSAKDLAGNSANQLGWSFTVASDSIIPLINAASPVGVTSNADTVITASFVEAGSGIDTSTVVLTLNGVTQAASAGAGSVTFTASGLADGVYTVTVDARDNAGNIANQLVWQFTVVSDVTAPIAFLVNPTDASPVTAKAGTTLDVVYYFDEANPESLSIHLFPPAPFIMSSKTVDLRPFTGIGSLTSVAQVNIPTGFPDGTYGLAYIVTDASGNTGTDQQMSSVLVDGTAPTASLNLPTGTVIDAGGNTTLTLQLDDATSGIDGSSVKLYLDGVLQTGATVQVNGLAASVSLTASGLSAGLHTVTVDYADVVGNEGATMTWSFTLVRDNTAPVISGILAPSLALPAYAHASGTADVRWSYSELNPISAVVRVLSGATVIGETVISAGLGSGLSLTRNTAVTLLQGAPEGVYDIQVTLHDVAGQSASLSSAAAVVVDNTAPVASAGLPAGGTNVLTASPVIQASLADAGGSNVDTGSVVLRVDGVVRTPSSLTGALVSYNATGLPDGLHTVSVELKDRSGNPAQSYVWSFTTDTQAPNVALTLPAAGAFVRGTPTVEALSSDAGSGVTRTAFYHGGTLIGTSWFNGVSWADQAGNAFAGAATLWDSTALADGSYVLSARSYDHVGNTGVSTNRIVTVDNTVPVLSINTVFSPTQYQAQTITGSITEQNLAQLRVNGILATLNGTAPNFTYSAVLPLVPGANGVTVTATDLAGNSASQFSAITMDPTAAVHFVHPAPGAIFRASTGIEVTAPSTANTLSLEVSDDGGSTWYSVGTPAMAATVTTLAKNPVNGWRHTWDTIADGLADANGSYQLRAVAYDQHGVQLGSAVVAGLSTDNTAPAISFVTLPAPVLVGPNLEVYQESIINQGTVTEAGPGQVRVLVEHYNSSNDHVSDSPAWLALLSDLRYSRDERLVDGLNRIVYTVVDGAGNSAQAETTVHYVLPQNSGTICAAGGGLATPDGTAIQVPSGALLSCADLSITTVLRSLMASPADSYLKIVGEGRQIDPVSLVFQAQAVLTLPYTDADLDPDNNGIPDYSPATLRILFWDGSLWQNKGVDSIDTVTRRVTVRTNHLGLFALAADTAPTPTEPKVYLTRNPFRYGTDRPTAFVYEMPVPGRVTIKIYDKSGDLVRTLVEDLPQLQGRFTQVWDGLNNFDRFVGSGIYLFRFEAKLDNGQTKTVTKAIGVLK